MYGISPDCNNDVKRLDAAYKVRIVDPYTYTMMQVLDVRGTDSILNVKKRVLDLINREEQADDNNVVIFHEPGNNRHIFTELDCDSEKLDLYKVKPYDNLFCVFYHKTLRGRCDVDSNGVTERIYRTSVESVFSFRLKIQDKHGIPFNKQKLVIPGLENPKWGDAIGTLKGLRLN